MRERWLEGNVRRGEEEEVSDMWSTRVANCALRFLKLPHSEAKGLGILNVNILGGSSSVLELLETIGNSASTSTK